MSSMSIVRDWSSKNGDYYRSLGHAYQGLWPDGITIIDDPQDFYVIPDIHEPDDDPMDPAHY